MGIINGTSFAKDYNDFMNRYDLYNISDQETLKKIISSLNDYDKLSLGQVKSDDFGIRTLIEQNWMIIKMLDSINKKLEK